MNEAWPLFENSLLVSPDHRLAAHANYWIALRAFKQHNRGKCEKHALAVRKCLSPKPGFLWEWNLDAKAALLLASLHGGSAQVDTRLYKPDFLNAMTKALERDLKSLMA